MINYFYNIIVKEDDTDLYSDVLTTIRKDFYLSREKQKGKITQNSSGDTLYYEFSLEKDKPIRWMLSDDDCIISDSKSIEEGKYCVSFYNDSGVSKILTFSKYHTLLKVEYFDLSVSSLPYCTIEPRKANSDLCLLMSKKNSLGSVVLFAMPDIDDEYILNKVEDEFTDYSAVASTNVGVVKFLSEEQLEQFELFVDRAAALKLTDTAPQSFIDEGDAVLAQKLNPKDFNIKRNLSETIDITQAQEFALEEDYDDFEDEIEVVDTAPVVEDEVDVDAVLSAFLADESPAQIEVVEAFDDHSYDYVEQTDAGEDTVCDAVACETAVDAFETDSIADDSFEVQSNQDEPNIQIDSVGGTYLYYGDVDDDGMRSGYGRTSTADGRTAYEGYYRNNKRDGVGSYYYKDGSLCYFGEWKENKRDGFGIGVSSFDKSVHVGSFADNKPVGDGVRINADGTTKFVKKILSNGLTVVLEFDGDKIIITKYNQDGEVVSENSSNLLYF